MKGCEHMDQLIINDTHIALPQNIMSKLKGKHVNVLEVEEGILLKISDYDPISKAKGILQSSNVSSEKFMQSKKIEKTLEL